MTALLERAIEEMYTLPESEQDVVARVVLDSIQDERHIVRPFAGAVRLRHDLHQLWETAGMRGVIEIDDRAAAFVTPKVRPVFDNVIKIMLEFAKAKKVELLSTEIWGEIDAGDGFGEISICQIINTSEDEAIRYWDDVCDEIQSFEETSMSPEEAWISRRISTSIRTPSVAI